MNGETNLSVLLQRMQRVLNAHDYVFCTVVNIAHPACEKAISIFREHEAITLVIEQSLAIRHHLAHTTICAWITLNVHSSLEAVGLTAAFSAALSKENISCNVVAAFYHDHIFVPRADAAKAMEILQGFQHP